MNIVKNLVTKDKYNIKCTYDLKAIGITVHNTANDASAENEVAYMIRNNNQVSFHYAVDDDSIVQAIPENRNAWHAGDGANGSGNRKTIAVEICYSKSGGSKFDNAEKNAAKFIAELLKKYKWTTENVYTHKKWSGKNCPHRTLDKGWDRFLKMVESELQTNQLTPTEQTKKSNTEIAKEVIDGKWGNGNDRKVALEKSGYNYSEIQDEVNDILNSNKQPSKKYLNLHPMVDKRTVYNSKLSKVGEIKPSKFGGLSYEIMRYTNSNRYVEIKTSDFGTVRICIDKEVTGNTFEILTTKIYKN